MSDWRGIGLTTVSMAIIGQVIHTVESILTMGYYMDPAYFSVWSKVMMPTAGPPPTEFYVYSVAFDIIIWAIFGFAFDKLGRALGSGRVFARGLKFGTIIFLVSGLSGTLSMFLLINLPTGLIAAWTVSQLVLYLIGGVVAARLIELH